MIYGLVIKKYLVPLQAVMKYKYVFILTVALLTTTTVWAQHRKKKAAEPDTAQVVKNYIDSLNVLRQQIDSLQRVNTALKSEVSDGRYYRLFVPTTFYHSGANRQLSLSPVEGDEVTEAVDEALMNLYLRRPDLVQNDESHLKKVGTLRDDVNQELTQQVDLVNIAAPVPEEVEIAPTQVVVKKPNFWKFKGEGYLQFLQNYVSENWHKGGESNYSAVAAANLELNYNDKDKLTFDNKLEMKLGFQTSRSDTVHKFKTNNDLIRLTSKLGLQAHKNWYYTLQMLAYTQFAPGLKANDERTYSDFTSPFDLNIGIGMQYKVNAFNGRLTGTLNFLPMSFNFRYVAREALISRNGMRGNHHTMEDFGSQFTGDLKWQIINQVSWKTRLYVNTTYHRLLAEWENLIELKVTKYISANLFLYPRFDDSTTYDENLGHFQFQEWSSIGLTYSF
jgi:hypothetical protein